MPVTSDFYANKTLTEPVNLMGFSAASPFQIFYKLCIKFLLEYQDLAWQSSR